MPVSTLAAGSLIIDAIGANFLAIFIIANLLTGVPNHTLDTIAVGDAMAMAILVAYMLAVTGIAVALRTAGVSLKVW